MLFSKAIQGYIFFMHGGMYSSVTIDYYQSNLRRVQNYLGDPPVESITTDDIRRFLASLGSLTGATRQVYWKVIRSFFAWAAVELNIKNPAIPIEAPKYLNKTIIPYTQQEIEALMKSAKSKRNRAMIMFLLDSGVRVSEMCRLTVLDLDLNTGMVRVNPYQTGKKSKPRVVYLGNNARRYLWQYISSRPDTGDKNAPLFATHNGKPLDRYAVKNILLRLSKVAGVTNVHPHKFRHTFAIEYLRNGGDIFTLQRLLGHSSLQMVKHYLNLADSDTQNAHRRASPVDRWRL